MADLSDVLERLITDPGFRQQLKDDPAVALEGYHLDEGELELLSTQIDEGSGKGGSVEQRTSKSALAGLLGLFGGGGGQGQYQESDFGFVGQHLEHDESGTELEKVSFTYQRIEVEGESDGPNELAIEDSAGPEGDELGRVKPKFVWVADEGPAAGVEHTDTWDQPTEMVNAAESSEEAAMELHEITFSKSLDPASPSEPGVDGVILKDDPSYPASGGFDGEYLVTSARHVVETDVEAVSQGESGEGVVDGGDFVVWRGQTGADPDDGPGETLGDNPEDVEADYHVVKMEDVVVTSIQPDEELPVEDIAGTQDAEPDQPIVIGRVYHNESPPPDESAGADDAPVEEARKGGAIVQADYEVKADRKA